MGVIDPLRPAARTLWSTGVRAARALRTRSLFIKQIYRDPYWYKLSTAERVRCYRYGFKPRLFALYDFETYDRDAYLNYFETDRHSNITSYDVSGNKYSFDRILRQEFAEFLPEVYAVVKNSTVLGPGQTLLAPDLHDWVAEAVTDARRLVFKPNSAYGGTDVFVLSREHGDLRIQSPSLKDPTLDDLEARITEVGPYIVTEFIEQAEYSAQIYPHATNTIRLLTIWDYALDEPFIADAIHRIGTDRSRPVDNCSEGGMSVGIDLKTGRLRRGVVDPGIVADIEWYTTHPDTGRRIEGVHIPHWETIQRVTCELAREVWYMPFAAWDIVPTYDGFKIVECNSMSALGMIQAHRPLLRDDRTRRFFRRHRVIE